MNIFWSNFWLCLSAVLPIFIILLIGYAAKRFHIIKEENVAPFNKVVFHVFFGFMCFNNIYRSDLSAAIRPKTLLFCGIGIFLVFALSLGYSLLFVKDRNQKGVVTQGLFRSNFNVVGLPIIAGLTGDSTLSAAAIVGGLTVITFNTLAVITLTIFNGKKLQIGKLLLSIVTNPLIIGSTLGLLFLLLGIKLPKVLESTVSMMAGVTSPLMLFLLGAFFRFGNVRHHFKPLLATVLGRLVIIPLLVVLPALLLGFRGDDFINDKRRYCLWLVGASPAEIKGMKEVYNRVQLCRQDRLNGAEDRQKLAGPDQNRRFFTLSDANITLQMKFPRNGLEGCLSEGLKKLTGEILGREYFRDDGAAMRIERCLVDANWGQSTDTVYQFCRESEYASVLTPSHGRYIGASSKPMGEYKKAVGDRVGMNWRMPNVRGKRAVRHVVYDTNFWKSFVATRLLTATGDRGALTLWGRSAEDHLLFAEHLTAEYRVKTEGRGRRVDEWKMRPDAHDNHWWDCIVGSAVAASMSGCVLAGTMTDGKPRAAAKPKVKLSELRRVKSF